MLVSRHLTYRAAERAAVKHRRALAILGWLVPRRVVVRRCAGLWRWEVVEL